MLILHASAMLAAYVGYFCGVWLGINSPEELKPGQRYLKILEISLYMTYLATSTYLFIITPVSIIHYALGPLIILTLLARILNVTDLVHYALMGLTLALFIGREQAFLLLAAILFLYGIPAGSLRIVPFSKGRRITRPKAALFKEAWLATWGYPWLAMVIIGVLTFFTV